ncbi:hypothetical protein CPC08DRAFT_425357 [Agrocybe pediades]|nr:hypothetical protein CPC08DRAFT_425357 [Agrocybe pediades]
MPPRLIVGYCSLGSIAEAEVASALSRLYRGSRYRTIVTWSFYTTANTTDTTGVDREPNDKKQPYTVCAQVFSSHSKGYLSPSSRPAKAVTMSALCCPRTAHLEA